MVFLPFFTPNPTEAHTHAVAGDIGRGGVILIRGNSCLMLLISVTVWFLIIILCPPIWISLDFLEADAKKEWDEEESSAFHHHFIVVYFHNHWNWGGENIFIFIYPSPPLFCGVCLYFPSGGLLFPCPLSDWCLTHYPHSSIRWFLGLVSTLSKLSFFYKTK